MKMKKMWEIAAKVGEEEGFGYFLTGWGSPDTISDDAEPAALRFRELWENVLPMLEEMEALIDDSLDNEDFVKDDEDVESEGDEEVGCAES